MSVRTLNIALVLMMNTVKRIQTVINHTFKGMVEANIGFMSLCLCHRIASILQSSQIAWIWVTNNQTTQLLKPHVLFAYHVGVC